MWRPRHAIIAPLIGLVADVYSLPQAMTVMGITVAVIGGIVLLMLAAEDVI